jgi:3-phenylpropionate/trans-cinnamate dioxygenase ferredoxin subunit
MMMEEMIFYSICSVEDLPPGERIFLELKGTPIVVFNIDGNFFAIEDTCTHDDGPLGDGDLEGHEIVCPGHGARFDVRTGEVLALPAVTNVRSFPVRVTDRKVEIGIEH